MSERALWNRLRMGTRKLGQFQRVENLLEAGWPDVNFCVRGIEGWMELKHCPAVPPRSAPFTRYRGLEDEQIDWIQRRVRNEGRVFIFAQIADSLYLLHGYHAPMFNGYYIDDFERESIFIAHRQVSAAQWVQFVDTLRRT